MPRDGHTEEVQHSAIWRYLPAGAAVLAAANFGLMWVGTQGTPLWAVATGLSATVFFFAIAVQVEAIYKHPERYPEVVRRVE